MRKLGFIVLWLVVLLPLFAEAHFYPMTTIAEDFTATWCGFCPDAYAALDTVHAHYDFTEFLSARYYNSSSNGGYATEETDARANFYGVTAFPTVVFNGLLSQVGGGTTVATGATYLPIVAANVYKASPIKAEITNFDITTGAVTANITMKSDTANLENVTLYFLLVENNVTDDISHLVRDVITQNFNLAGLNNVYTSTQTFDISQIANAANCKAYIFVQKTDKEILNAASSDPTPMYKVRMAMEGGRTFMGPVGSTTLGPDLSIFNIGRNESVTVTITSDEAPAGSIYLGFCDEEQCYPAEATFSMPAGTTKTIHTTVLPMVAGMVRYHLTINSPNIQSPIIVPFTFISNGTQVLIVDDDESNYETYMKNACQSLGVSYGIWNLSDSKLSPIVAQNFNNLLWSCGLQYPTVDATDRAFLSSYLDTEGKHLFITGQDIGWDLNQSDNNVDATFYHNYLHANFVNDNVNVFNLAGITGSIMDGINIHIAGGDGANNQLYPSSITPNGTSASSIFDYENNHGTGAICATHGTNSEVVYFAFGYEAIDNAASCKLVMKKILQYFDVDVTATDDPSVNPLQNSISKIYPNPFNPETNIEFTMGQTANVKISIYNTKGQKVRTLINETRSVGTHTIHWDGKNDKGTGVSSGIYFVNLNSKNFTNNRKIILMK